MGLMLPQLMMRFFGLNMARKDDKNAWFLIIEIFWASFLSAGASFNSAFALRLGASNSDIGLLTSIPALLAIIVSIPAGRIIQNLEHRKPWVVGSLAIHRGAFIFLVLLPFLAGTSLPLGPISVWVLILIGIPAYFFNIGFIPMLADTVSEERRAAVFSGRQVVYNAAVSVLIFGLGQWLKYAAYPMNYQVMLLVGVLTSFVSIYYLIQIKVPDHKKQPGDKLPVTLVGELKAIRQSLTDTPGFGHMVRNTFFQALGLWVASPLYILYFVKTLKADESWLGLNGTIVSIVTIFAYMIWRRWMSRIGEPLTLKITIVIAGAYPLLVGLSPSLTLILMAGAFYAFFQAGVGLSHLNTLLRVIPEDARPQYTAYYTALMNAGAFVAPLVGIQLSNIFGLAPTLIGCGIAAALGGLTFTLWPVLISPPKPKPILDEVRDGL
jgi:MFS family permease